MLFSALNCNVLWKFLKDGKQTESKWYLRLHLVVFNKFCFLLVSIIVLFSDAIYASEDTDILPLKSRVDDSSLCYIAAQQASRDYGVDADLLHSISAVETGRWNDLQKRYVAWPWTVNVNGKGYFYASKEEALAAIKSFQEKGISSMDIGCMQINVKYHGDNFANVEDIIDPIKNVKYGAKFLRTLYSRNGKNWELAAKKYHSANPERGSAYAKRLEKRFEKFKLAGFSRGVSLF